MESNREVRKIIQTDDAPQAIGTYSQGVMANGIVYFSGQIGLNPKTGKMAIGVEGQIQQILDNIDGLLKSCQLERKDIIKTSVFLVDLNDFSMVNQAYQNYFSSPYPARSCVQVSALPKQALVEIEVMACAQPQLAT